MEITECAICVENESTYDAFEVLHLKSTGPLTAKPFRDYCFYNKIINSKPINLAGMVVSENHTITLAT